MSDKSFPELKQRLCSALLSDALDECGVQNQVMAATVRPLDESLVLCGRARTAIYLEVCQVSPGENPYAREIELVDSLEADEIAVMACGGSRRIAPWGGLLSTASRARRAGGCVTDGFIRDTKVIRALEFPVFHGGILPLDSKGRGVVREIDVPVLCGGARVCPADLVFGDADGVVVIPRDAEDKVLSLAFKKLARENHSMDELRAGALLREVYDRYKVL